MSESSSIFSDASTSDCGSVFSDASDSDMETEIAPKMAQKNQQNNYVSISARKNSFEFQKPLEVAVEKSNRMDYHADEYPIRKYKMNLVPEGFLENAEKSEKKLDESVSSISSSVSSLSPPGGCKAI